MSAGVTTRERDNDGELTRPVFVSPVVVTVERLDIGGNLVTRVRSKELNSVIVGFFRRLRNRLVLNSCLDTDVVVVVLDRGRVFRHNRATLAVS